MADNTGQAQIRGLYIDKVARTYLEEATIFKGEVTNATTPNRQIRWYQKTSGYLTATSPAKIGGIAEGARPFVLRQSWTRNTSYVKKYFVESDTINMEDESDSDVSVFRTTLRDLTDAVAYDLDGDIWNTASEDQSATNINSVTSTAAWDAASGQNPPEDIFEAEQLIREQTKRKVTNAKLYLSAKGAKDLKEWVITNGTQFTDASSDLLLNGVLVKFCGFPIVVSENVTADYALLGDMKQAVEYKQFKPMQTAIINDEGIGRKIRVWTHGIPILVKPKYLALISNTEE